MQVLVMFPGWEGFLLFAPYVLLCIWLLGVFLSRPLQYSHRWRLPFKWLVFTFSVFIFWYCVAQFLQGSYQAFVSHACSYVEASCGDSVLPSSLFIVGCASALFFRSVLCFGMWSLCSGFSHYVKMGMTVALVWDVISHMGWQSST